MVVPLYSLRSCLPYGKREQLYTVSVCWSPIFVAVCVLLAVTWFPSRLVTLTTLKSLRLLGVVICMTR